MFQRTTVGDPSSAKSPIQISAAVLEAFLQTSTFSDFVFEVLGNVQFHLSHHIHYNKNGTIPLALSKSVDRLLHVLVSVS